MKRVLVIALCVGVLISALFPSATAFAAETGSSAWITDAEINGEKIGISVFSNQAMDNIRIVVAAYLTGGKMADCAVQSVSLQDGGNRFVMELPTGGETYKVFLLGGNFQPLCQAVETADTPPEDYFRAFRMGYVDESYARRDKSERMYAQEFKAMLEALITKTAPDQLSLFQSKITDYETPLTRNQAVVMCWYAAVCVGADDAYSGGEEIDYMKEIDKVHGPDAFWQVDDMEFSISRLLLPEMEQYDLPIETKFWGTTTNVRTVACAWNVWHLSPTWGMPTIEANTVEMSMCWDDPFTVEDAVCAVSRLYDSWEDDQVATFVPADSAEATAADAGILTPEIIRMAQNTAAATVEEMPRLGGVALENIMLGEDEDAFVVRAYEAADVADWGFNQVAVILTYKHLFNDDASQVNLKSMKKLDELVATAVSRGLHVTLDIFNLPGHHWYINAEDNFHTTWENSIYIDDTKLAQAEKVCAILAQRYQDLPGTALSFLPFPTSEDLITSDNSSHTVKYHESHTPKQQFDMTVRVEQSLMEAIRAVDSDRMLLYTIPFNYYENGYLDAAEYQIAIDSYEDFGQVRPFNAFVQEPYVYYNMNDVGGRQADTQNNAMFIGTYPVRIDAAQKHITGPDYAGVLDDPAVETGAYAGEHDLTLGGVLPAGTTVEVYIERWKGGGTFRIDVDGVTKANDAIDAGEITFFPGEVLSRRVRFAESTKCYSFTLEEGAESIKLSCTGAGQVWWSGIRITLPAEYAVQRIYKDTEYSANLEHRDYEGISYRSTSEILIGANTDATEWHIMVSDNAYRGGEITVVAGDGQLGYTSDAVYEEASAGTIAKWGEVAAQFGVQFQIYWECAAYGSAASAMAYYEDMLAMFDKHGFGWNGRYEYVQLISATDIDAQTVKRGRYLRFNEERLQVILHHR